ncbi:DUF3300 domain-containing protein [Herbaspirillum sp. LeCh32-8]|uniref:DUF3300 domain-containing protein n=1 Tax=Herbaspirillum sp. LeCh32-8 TaxID=2821356 RepID=UPI001AE5B0CB|nr:DUF3300 domain-containing protein [Herbaspirillum sp. LeCh32-8]
MNKKTLAWAACLVFSLVSGMPMAQAQSNYPVYPTASYTQEQLDQMLAPVALYPDSLLAQVLMAATYPLEVVQAQRFVEARPGLQGDGLARAVAPMPWDPSVKSLVQFPSVLAMMNDRLDWTQQLGQAFLAQQGSVMDTVQDLRERAQVAGSLQSSPQQRVLADDGLIVIEPINPQVVYVPYYNPVVVYGSWWWPSAPPMVWTPPPRYRPPHYSPGVAASISFGSGIGVMRAAFGDARPDWRQRQVMVTQTRITNVTNDNVTNNVTINRNVTVNQRPVVWHHDARFGGPRAQAGQRPGQTPQQAGGRPEGPRGAPPQQAQQQGQPGPQAHPAAQFAPPAAQPGRPAPQPNAQQRVVQQDQERQREAREQQLTQTREVQVQQRQREQQAHEQQRQREQMVNDQQRQREQMARDQRQQQQAQERNVQQRQQQMHDMQMQQAQQAREQQHQAQQQQQQRQQQEQARQHQEQARQQQDQARREQQARPPQHDRRDERRDDGK